MRQSAAYNGHVGVEDGLILATVAVPSSETKHAKCKFC